MFGNNANHLQKKNFTDGTSSSPNSVRARYQGTLPDISEDDSVSQVTYKPVGSIQKETKKETENKVIDIHTKSAQREKVCEEIAESVMKDKSVVTRIAGLKERLTMLSLMINDCQASFEEKKKYRKKRKQQALFYKTIINIVLIIIVIGSLCWFIHLKCVDFFFH